MAQKLLVIEKMFIFLKLNEYLIYVTHAGNDKFEKFPEMGILILWHMRLAMQVLARRKCACVTV